MTCQVLYPFVPDDAEGVGKFQSRRLYSKKFQSSYTILIIFEGGGHELLLNIPGKKRGFLVSYDISRGL
jgi:hypothetical protein